MNIVDYCAEKAYNVYSQRYIVDNQDKLDDIEKLDFKQKQDFIPQFTIDLKKNIANFLDDYTEDKDIVRKSLTQILKNNFDNLQQNNIIDLSGRINVNAITANLNQGVKESLPDIYEKVQNVKQSKEALDKNSSKTSVDFNNPEERKKYFDDLYKGLSECKTKEEKISYIEDEFGLSLEDMSDKEQDEIISKFEIRGKIREIKNALDIDSIQQENPDLSKEELDQLLEDTAVEQYALENDTDVKIEKINNNRMIELENTISEIKKLEQDLLNCTDETKKAKIYNEITEISNKQNELIQTLAISEDEIEKFSENIEEQDEKKKSPNENSNNEIKEDAEFLELFNENEPEEDLSNLFTEDELKLDDLFAIEENETEEDLAYLFDAEIDDLEKIPEIDEKVNNEQPISENDQVFTNPILIGADENDLKQEDYTIEVEEKESLWNKIKSGFSKIKDSILKKLNFNQNKQLNGQAYLDTAENNIRSTNGYAEMQNTFDQSLQVSKKEQEKYKKEYEASKNSKFQSNILEVEKNSGQSIDV